MTGIGISLMVITTYSSWKSIVQAVPEVTVVTKTINQSINQSRIQSLFYMIDDDMPYDQILRLLGPSGDYRIDPNAAYRRAYPTLPWGTSDPTDLFRSSLFYTDDLPITHIWHWDHGSIGLGITKKQPRRVIYKRMMLQKGPRPVYDQLLDPLRDVLEDK